MEGSKTLFCSSKFPWARERISSTKFIDNLGTRPKKGSPDLTYNVPLTLLMQHISARLCFPLSHLQSSGIPNLPLIATVKLTKSFGLCHAASMLETCSGICEGRRHISCMSARTELKRRTSVKNCTKTLNYPHTRRVQ